eukprot:365340-Chlamydomonas_euryale.AAC.2
MWLTTQPALNARVCATMWLTTQPALNARVCATVWPTMHAPHNARVCLALCSALCRSHPLHPGGWGVWGGSRRTHATTCSVLQAHPAWNTSRRIQTSQSPSPPRRQWQGHAADRAPQAGHTWNKVMNSRSMPLGVPSGCACPGRLTMSGPTRPEFSCRVGFWDER